MTSPTSSGSTSSVGQTTSLNINALLSGDKWGGVVGTGVTLTYSFPWTSLGSATFSGHNGIGDYSSLNEQNATYHYGLNTTQQAAARSALQSWANVANIVFSEVAETSSNVGDIRFAWTSATDFTSTGGQAWGWGNYPNSYWPSGGDIWISTLNSNTATNSWATGSYNFEALIHELGHTLGLKHPFEDMPVLSSSLDNRLYTIMSYTEPPNNIYPSAGYVDGHYVWLSYYVCPETPMVLDIAAIQYIYGANTSYHTGNDIYTFDNTKPFFETLWDANGIDTISAINYILPCVIDLTPGHYSSLRIPQASDTGGVTTTYDGSNDLGIAYGCIIENAIGGSGDDTLIGNSSNNQLIGVSGNDTVVFTGNYASYTIAYNRTSAHFTITDKTSGRDGSDDVFGVEYFRFADITRSASQLMVSAVDSAAPTVSIFSPSDGVTGVSTTVNIVLTFSEMIQRGIGSILLKNAAGTTIEAFDAASSDRLLISGSTLTIDPTDTLANDIHYYVTLDSGTIKNLAGNGYAGISTYDFTTATGIDYLGTVGNNILASTPGNDSIDGGLGTDTVLFSGNRSDYTITPIITTGGYILSGEGDGTDTLINIERLNFEDKNIALDMGVTESGGEAVLIIGALVGPSRLNDSALVGELIGYFDAGNTLHDAATLLVNSGTVNRLAGGSSTNDFVNLIYRCVIGHEATASDTAELAGLIDGGSYSRVDFLAIVAGIELNQTHVGLFGLQQTGIEFV